MFSAGHSNDGTRFAVTTSSNASSTAVTQAEWRVHTGATVVIRIVMGAGAFVMAAVMPRRILARRDTPLRARPVMGHPEQCIHQALRPRVLESQLPAPGQCDTANPSADDAAVPPVRRVAEAQRKRLQHQLPLRPTAVAVDR
jgi:hypothetical protein